MADEMEDILNEEIGIQEERLRKMAFKMEELAGIDCPLGVCVFDPKMLEMEHKLEEIQHHKEVIVDALNTLRRHRAV